MLEATRDGGRYTPLVVSRLGPRSCPPLALITPNSNQPFRHRLGRIKAPVTKNTTVKAGFREQSRRGRKTNSPSRFGYYLRNTPLHPQRPTRRHSAGCQAILIWWVDGMDARGFHLASIYLKLQKLFRKHNFLPHNINGVDGKGFLLRMSNRVKVIVRGKTAGSRNTGRIGRADYSHLNLLYQPNASANGKQSPI